MKPFATSRLLTAALAVLGAALLAAPAAAQGRIEGRVVDRQSGRGIGGARVEVLNHRHVAITDSAGRYTLRGIRAGQQAFIVSALGYTSTSVGAQVTAGEPNEVPVVPLTPNPVMLEALEVSVDRFEARRLSVPVPSRVFADEQLALSAAPNVLFYLRERGSVFAARCGGGRQCIMVRGRPVVPRVFVDDVPHALDVLETYDLHEVSRVEVYRSGAAIHVYTPQYMARAARIGRVPMPVAI